MSSGAYPIIWAMKHAPVADALERLILIAMADAADSDGCNSYRSIRSHMLIAKDVDKSTIIRRQHNMQKRGLIRPDTTPPPARYLKIPKNRRPARWELCIPHSWWSDAQREEIQREREDKGLPRITPQSRPDLPDAPAKKHRADKGTPNPNRRRKETRAAEATQPADVRGGTETPQESELRGVSETPSGVAQRHPRGCLEDTQPSFVYLPVEPSSSYAANVGGSQPHRPGDPTREEEEAERLNKTQALELVDAAVAKWDPQHRRPNISEWARIAEKVTEALAQGASPDAVVYALTRDLRPGQVNTTAVQVVRSRIKQTGWAEQDKPAAKPTVLRPPWCGGCDEQTRLVDAGSAMHRCPKCHPLAVAS
jgi:hypothetical protein